jgi:UDP-N-acetylenolpyruvoylglucosamine reductase
LKIQLNKHLFRKQTEAQNDKNELLLEVTEGLENMTKLPERPGCFGAALYMNCDADCAFKEDCAKGNKALFEGINLEFENEELEAEIEPS